MRHEIREDKRNAIRKGRGGRDIVGEKQVLEPNPSGDPVGSAGSQRLFRSGVPTIGGELGGSGGMSCAAPFVKEAPRSGQMSNPVGNRLSFYIYTHTRTRLKYTYAPLPIHVYRSTIAFLFKYSSQNSISFLSDT